MDRQTLLLRGGQNDCVCLPASGFSLSKLTS